MEDVVKCTDMPSTPEVVYISFEAFPVFAIALLLGVGLLCIQGFIHQYCNAT